jgi:hypothetical protein
MDISTAEDADGAEVAKASTESTFPYMEKV